MAEISDATETRGSMFLVWSVQGVRTDQTKSGLPMLPEEAIKEYKLLYKKRFGVDLSDDEARRRAENLVKLYKAVYGGSSLDMEKTDVKK